MLKRRLLVTALSVVAAISGHHTLMAQTDVTSTFINNPSFENEDVSSLTQVGTKGGDDASYRGWTLEQPAGWTVSNPISGQLKEAEAYTDNGFGTVGTMADGKYCYYLRQGWNTGSSKIAQTITGELPAGEYTFSAKVKAFRNGNVNSAYYLSANGVNSSSTTFTAGSANGFTALGWSEAKVKFVLDEPTANVELAINVNWQSGGSQIAIDDIRLSVEPFATAADKEALSAAISASETYTIGFEAGEYAPYNNTEAILALAAAKAIDLSANSSQVTIQNLTPILSTAWTVNETQKNGFYRGDFAEYQTSDIVSNDRATAIGWSNTDRANCGVVGLRDSEPAYGGSNNAGLGGLASKKALYLRGGHNTTYGTTPGYNLPLRANAVYTLSFTYGGWGQHMDNAGTVSVGQSGSDPVYKTSVHTTGNGNDSAEAWQTFNASIQTTEAGDYNVTLNFVAGGQSAFSDFSLTFAGYQIAAQASALPETDLTADTWYYFDIATAGDYKLTATDLSAISFVTDGKLVDNTEGNAFVVNENNVLNLEAGRYYVKSSAAQTLNVAIFTLANADDYAALTSAIEDAEKKLGFETGEYAPYNNVAMLAQLDKAKLINTTVDNPQTSIQALTEAIAADKWTANETEVNAFFDGSFDAAKENVSINTLPKGWHGSDVHPNDALLTRYVYSDNSSNSGLYEHFDNHSAMMSKSFPVYGKDKGYTLPLKANTWYKLTFDFGGWGDCSLSTTVVVKDAEGNSVAVSPAESTQAIAGAQGNADNWQSYTGYFKTTGQGDYTVQLTKEDEGNDAKYQIAYGNIELKKATDIVKSSSANLQGYKSFYSAEANYEVDANTDIYTATAPANGYVVLTRLDGKVIPAGNAVLVQTANEYDITFSLTDATSTDDFSTNALRAATNDGALDAAYILAYTSKEGLGFYQFAGEFKKGDVYLPVTASEAKGRLIITLNKEEATGINGIVPAQNDKAAFNVAGQRVTEGYQGLIIKNGKKYLTK